jgi:DNA helicase II / ATP-dependent DNA helicase PcrA
MQQQNNFKKIYSQLNPEQKIAVDTIEGPVMVMAGPGTGKTQVLATRVANILQQQDIDPQNILALTFTDAAAQNMRERIVAMTGTDGFYVNIMTFHAFASEVISQYPEKFPIEKGSEPLSDFERFETFETIILNSDLQDLKPLNAPLYYIKHIISQISQLKREYITPEKFETILEAEEKQLEKATEDYWAEQKEKAVAGKKAKTKLSSALLKQTKNLGKQKELHVLYIKYLAELHSRKRYDFDDMITFVVQAFETDEELLLDYQERFQYILVDEYQDTNAAQNKIVEKLASFWADMGDPPNVFVVGDPHQSIFRFQGASTENMLEFVDTYPGVTVVTLATGYRCSSQVYNAAHDLIGNNALDFGNKDLDAALSQKLKSAKGKGADITVYAAESETLELLYLAEEIKKLEKSDVALEDIAVLYRNNKEAVLIKEVLEKWEIGYELAVGGNVFDDLMVQQLITFFKVLMGLGHGSDTEDLFTVMQYSWLGLEVLDVYKLARIAGRLRTSLAVVLEKDYSEVKASLEKKSQDGVYGLTQESFESLVGFKNKLLDWYRLSNNLLFHEWFSLIINADNSEISGSKEAPKPNGFSFMQYVLSQPVKTDHLYAINSLFSEVKKFVNRKRDFTLDDFLNTVAVMQEHGVNIKVEDLNITKNRVSLSTAHGSKGKEWQYVFVFGCTDKKWGNQRTRELIPLPDSILLNTDIEKKEKNEDDRRLFYVALTRSAKKTYILWSKTKTNGKEMMNSMFINEVGDNAVAVSEKDSKALLEKSEGLLEKILTSSSEPAKTYSDSEREFFKYLVGEFKLSVTALNTYLADPHEFMINSLLRVPRAKSPILAFGTAVHAAMESFYLSLMSGKPLSKEEVIKSFETALMREQLLEGDFIERKKHGQKVLDFYYDQVLDPDSNTLRSPLFVEKFFGGKLNKAMLLDGQEEIRLSGRIDRVELLDKDSKTIRVIDYKTGKPKSENVINGQSSIDNYSDREKELPETIRGRYQRQLVFYKLLAELDKTFPYNVTQAEFDFIEPGGAHKDKHIVRSFAVSDKAVEDLKILIKEVMGEIRELKFLE